MLGELELTGKQGHLHVPVKIPVLMITLWSVGIYKNVNWW